jgi:hypothetical protein
MVHDDNITHIPDEDWDYVARNLSAPTILLKFLVSLAGKQVTLFRSREQRNLRAASFPIQQATTSNDAHQEPHRH